MSKPRKPVSGGARLMAAGLKPMVIGWRPEDRNIIEEAARLDGRPMAQFVYHHALTAARALLRKHETE